MKCNQIISGNLSSVYFGDQVLNCRPFCKYLGVFLDHDLLDITEGIDGDPQLHMYADDTTVPPLSWLLLLIWWLPS